MVLFEGLLPPKVLGAVQMERCVASRTFSWTPASATTQVPASSTPVPRLPPTPRQSSNVSQCSQGCPWPGTVHLLHLRTERTSRQAASGTLVRVPASFLIPAPRGRRLPDTRAAGSWAPQSHSSCVWSPLPPSGQRTLPQTQTVSFSRQRSWVGLALLTFVPFGQDGPAAAPQSPSHHALSSGIHPAEQRATERCLRS